MPLSESNDGKSVWVGCGLDAGQCGAESVFLKVTLVSFLTVTVEGLNPVLVILIITSLLETGGGGGGLGIGVGAGAGVGLGLRELVSVFVLVASGVLLQAAAIKIMPKPKIKVFFIYLSPALPGQCD